jgi:DNA replication protein DnaC
MQPQLKQLGLTQLEKALPALYETARLQQWTYETFMKQAIASEIEGRDRRAAERRMTAAHLPAIKTLEAFEFAFQPDLSERLLWELADLSFVQTATNVIFLGAPGLGKTRPTHYPYRAHHACAGRNGDRGRSAPPALWADPAVCRHR